jgi:outer membrane protein assembly factor BamA
MTRKVLWGVVSWLLLLPAVAAGQGEERPPEASKPRPTGWAVQGLPLLNYNVDEGLGYGAMVMLVDRADGSYSPYRYSVVLQFFQTTLGIAAHRLSVDAPNLLGSPWRVGVDLNYAENRFAPYYGLGNTSEYVPGFSSCEDREALSANPDACPGNADFRGLRYYTYDIRGLPRISLNVRRALADPFKLYLGYRLRMERLRLRYSTEELGQSGGSRLMEDLDAGRLSGPGGSPAAEELSWRTSELRAGIQYDTRDIEASPSAGMYHELSVRGGLGLLGSQSNYWGATLHARLYHRVVPGYERLVAAWRGIFDVMGGEVPFFLMPSFGGLDGMDGLGGVFSARGLLKNRFQGPVKLLLNGELRWTPLSATLLSQQFDFSLVGFVDSGRVWSDLDLRDGGGLNTAAGGGLRVAWNREFVIRMDYGLGLTAPSTGFYLEFGQIF